MKILTFNYEYPPLGGGGGVVHALIAEELARRHTVYVITSAFEDLPRRESRGGVEIIRVPVVGRRNRSAASLVSLLSYPPAAWISAWRLLRGETFDVINSHFAVPTGPGSIPPARLAGIPHVMSLHGGDIFDPSKKLSPHRLVGVRSAVNWVLNNSSAVVAQSSNTRENTYRFYSYRGPIEIIPLGIRQPNVPPASRTELGLPEDRFLAITVGRLVKRKGIDQLLHALASPECRQADLIVVGDGPERAGWEKLAERLGLRERVRFMGHVVADRKWQLLQCADAYVSATLHEGFGLVYLEGMAAGLPIVTYDHGGQIDFLRHQETGYLVPLGSTAGLATAISRLISNPNEVARFRRKNLELAPQHRIEECARRYELLLQRVADGWHPNLESAQDFGTETGA